MTAARQRPATARPAGRRWSSRRSVHVSWARPSAGGRPGHDLWPLAAKSCARLGPDRAPVVLEQQVDRFLAESLHRGVILSGQHPQQAPRPDRVSACSSRRLLHPVVQRRDLLRRLAGGLELRGVRPAANARTCATRWPGTSSTPWSVRAARAWSTRCPCAGAAVHHDGRRHPGRCPDSPRIAARSASAGRQGISTTSAARAAACAASTSAGGVSITTKSAPPLRATSSTGCRRRASAATTTGRSDSRRAPQAVADPCGSRSTTAAVPADELVSHGQGRFAGTAFPGYQGDGPQAAPLRVRGQHQARRRGVNTLSSYRR